jgi:hypothetical protein
MVKAYLLTFMTRQHYLLGTNLAARFPHCWLVWEPGSWKAPASDENTISSGSLSPLLLEDALSKGDALCFALKPPAPGNAVLRVGRAVGCDLVINDGTVSREHLTLRLTPEGQWMAERKSQHRPTLHRGIAFPLRGEVALKDGDKLVLGEITLTFYTQRGFSQRLEAEMRKQLPTPPATGNSGVG